MIPYYIRIVNDDLAAVVYIGDFKDDDETTDYLDIHYPVTYPLFLYRNGTDRYDDCVAWRSQVSNHYMWEYSKDYRYEY